MRGVATCRTLRRGSPSRLALDAAFAEVVSLASNTAPGRSARRAGFWRAARRPPRRSTGGALRVLGRTEIRLGAVGAQFLDDVGDFALCVYRDGCQRRPCCSVLLQLESSDRWHDETL